MMQEPITPNGNDNKENDITPEERALLDAAGEDDEEQRLRRATLDSKDEDGDLLNEISGATDRTGRDLDVPGSSADDAMEDIGEEDEENNSYSQADTE